MRRTNTRRALAVLTAATGLLVLGATSAHADGRPGAASSADSAAEAPGVRETLRGVIETAQQAVPEVPEGGGVEVPEIVPGVPSVGIVPLSLPGLPVTPDLTEVPGLAELPANPADVPDKLPLP
ncbi:hypothetical protein DVA86_10035 [Streptomyces armeniacus]|uniref:ATP-binding protein n=1 Tax=Streptomyces armeniacus TaxID=83291 RepID=A0A345XMS2_9ACTN|nr:hypothetical protein [Streptomyces armeniacus]AXK32938.1 hypothetical protein DVA86_10035 [Streptomyces armeniacus]